MSVQLSPPNVYGNLGKFRKETDVNIFSGVIYENYPKPQKEEKLQTNGCAKEPEINVPIGSKGAKSSSSRLMLLGLGILCLLLVVSIIIISWISVELVKQKAKVKNWENQTKQLNRMREAILTFENFPVKDFCPENKCQPCQKDWIPFQGKCYLFYESYCDSSMNAQLFCHREAADLVFVDNLQELEFLKNHTNVFYNCPYKQSCFNVLLYVPLKKFGYWAEGGLLTPEGNITENWSSEGYYDRNRFICEGEEMPWPK